MQFFGVALRRRVRKRHIFRYMRHSYWIRDDTENREHFSVDDKN